MPKVYKKAQHQIDIGSIDPHAVEIIHKLQQAGHETYLVGGSVRDLLLGHIPKDYDISTAAKPEEIKRIFKRSCILIGRRFRLAHVRAGRKVFEVSTFRSGDTSTDQLIERDNVWGTPIEDVTRRDFTMNGLFYNPEKEEIIDYVGGFLDIQKQTLKSIGEPVLRFKQDPVRMIRLLKFEARFSLTVDEELRVAFQECKADILKSSPARILEEILRMLESGSANKFIKLTAEHGLLQFLFPKLSDFLETPKGNIIYDYLQEVDYLIKEFPNARVSRAIPLSCLVYPIVHEKVMQKTKDKTPHLGQIQNWTLDIIQQIFHPFLSLPRKLRSDLTNIIYSQYRLTPVNPKLGKRRRLPKTPNFYLAMQFLNLRYRLNPTLKEPWEKWSELFHIQRKRKR